MKITFNISPALARTLEEACQMTSNGLEDTITPANFAKDCLEAELASRRLTRIPRGERPVMAGGRGGKISSRTA